MRIKPSSIVVNGFGGRCKTRTAGLRSVDAAAEVARVAHQSKNVPSRGAQRQYVRTALCTRTPFLRAWSRLGGGKQVTRFAL